MIADIGNLAINNQIIDLSESAEGIEELVFIKLFQDSGLIPSTGEISFYDGHRTTY